DLGNEVEVEEVDLDNELTVVATGGVSLRLSDRVSFAADVRYVPYSPNVSDVEDGDGDGESVDVNPLIVSAGIRFRF
ncbi:MAG TPA: OmpW family outer membrane protein, partial [Thermoanaerobaculia bacterium]|nr:OmpW family outer membrane protein [Thermoanaerobaculia bacterium]